MIREFSGVVRLEMNMQRINTFHMWKQQNVGKYTGRKDTTTIPPKKMNYLGICIIKMHKINRNTTLKCCIRTRKEDLNKSNTSCYWKRLKITKMLVSQK